ncbi:WD repeat-containing protein [Perkinsela sp. CCAP 1560/4]|nr:WD repeat-containing protein [Perkinsela sp. CCAP 1560/4]|eukprot:KNH07416.1 WD repeat-containing protein [Perkinsela sp. CCAP 1560/4]
MRIVAFSASERKAFEVDTETKSISSISLSKPIGDALREGKTPSSSRDASVGRKFCGYSRAHDCLITIRNSPPRVNFHKSFSKTLTESIFVKTRQTADFTVSNGMEFQAEGKIERRRRLKKERLERREKDESTQPHTIEMAAKEHVSSFFLHPAEDFFILGGKMGGLTLWSIGDCRVLEHWEVLHYGGISSISVSSSHDHILTTGEDDTIRLWAVGDIIRTASSESTRPVAVGTFRFPSARMLCAQFLPFARDRAVMTTKDGFIRCINLEDGSIEYEKQFSSHFDHMLFSPCQRYLIVSSGAAQSFALHISDILSSSTKRSRKLDFQEEMRLDAPVLFPDEKQHSQVGDIFLSIARGKYLKQKMPEKGRRTKMPLQVQLVGNHQYSSVGKEISPSERFRFIVADVLRSRVCAMDGAGGMVEWAIAPSMTTSNQAELDTSRGVIEATYSNPNFLHHSIDFACVLSDGLRESVSTVGGKPESVPNIELDAIVHPPLTMPTAKRKMHEERAARRPRAVSPTRPPAIDRPDELVEQPISDMIPFNTRADFEGILASRLKLQNTAQSLRDEILHLEKIATKIRDAKSEEPME